jgi:D-alanyl-D-alanine carboxypeptidase (penicillin-binding protein 5/6)
MELINMSSFRSLAVAALATGLAAHSYAITAMPLPPALDNKAYALVDYDTGQILAAVNENEQLPPASMTKMLTSFIIEQKLMSGHIKENDMVRMNESAWCRGSSTESCMYVPLNGSASVLDMLRGIIIQSGNDASKAMAEHISGNEGAFAEVMNQEAKRLGMTNSHFMNSTGMPMDGHFSSALDMAILARHIIKDSSKYYPIYSEKEFTFNGIKQGNRNALLYTDPSVDGLKTGHTEAAGYCLVASSKRGPMRLIAVVMGTKSMDERANQTRALLNWGFSNFESTTLRPAGQTLATTPVWFGKADEVTIGLKDSLSVTLPRGQAANIKSQLVVNPDLKAPIAKGQVIGKVIATLEGKTLSEQPLVALQAVEESGFFARLMDHIKIFFSKFFK